jgi:hypothetical protein
MASLCAAAAPVFTNLSPESTIVNVSAGQTSFQCTGSAFDHDVGHTVDFFTIGRPSFMNFETVPGNPASFRLYADHLTLAQYGGYIVDVVAYDDTPVHNLSGSSFVIGIVPEPASISFGIALLFTQRRRR